MQMSVDLNREVKVIKLKLTVYIKTSDLSSRDYNHFRSIMKKKLFSHNPLLIKRSVDKQQQKMI